MYSPESIRNKIAELYKIHPEIHISIETTHPKLTLVNGPAVIKRVYSHIFQVEEKSSGSPQCHTFQYTDILIKKVEIKELSAEKSFI
ncbi:MAG: hypothetical protein IJ289_05365 [Clostridia bacterium]|nr:hypothetical protein [Clostridia bacterium]